MFHVEHITCSHETRTTCTFINILSTHSKKICQLVCSDFLLMRKINSPVWQQSYRFDETNKEGNPILVRDYFPIFIPTPLKYFSRTLSPLTLLFLLPFSFSVPPQTAHPLLFLSPVTNHGNSTSIVLWLIDYRENFANWKNQGKIIIMLVLKAIIKSFRIEKIKAKHSSKHEEKN
jgi:hypothetical protein